MIESVDARFDEAVNSAELNEPRKREAESQELDEFPGRASASSTHRPFWPENSGSEDLVKVAAATGVAERLSIVDPGALDKGSLSANRLAVGWDLDSSSRSHLETVVKAPWISFRPMPWRFQEMLLEVQASFEFPRTFASESPAVPAVPGFCAALLRRAAVILPGPGTAEDASTCGDLSRIEAGILELYRQHSMVVIPDGLVGDWNRGGLLHDLGVQVRYDRPVALLQDSEVRTIAGTDSRVRLVAEACGKQAVIWGSTFPSTIVRRRLLASRPFWLALLAAANLSSPAE